MMGEMQSTCNPEEALQWARDGKQYLERRPRVDTDGLLQPFLLLSMEVPEIVPKAL